MRCHPLVQGRKPDATCFLVSPLLSAIRTASARNSSVRFSPIVHLLCRNKCYQRSGIKPRQVQAEEQLRRRCEESRRRLAWPKARTGPWWSWSSESPCISWLRRRNSVSTKQLDGHPHYTVDGAEITPRARTLTDISSPHPSASSPLLGNARNLPDF